MDYFKCDIYRSRFRQSLADMRDVTLSSRLLQRRVNQQTFPEPVQVISHPDIRTHTSGDAVWYLSPRPRSGQVCVSDASPCLSWYERCCLFPCPSAEHIKSLPFTTNEETRGAKSHQICINVYGCACSPGSSENKASESKQGFLRS